MAAFIIARGDVDTCWLLELGCHFRAIVLDVKVANAFKFLFKHATIKLPITDAGYNTSASDCW